jgi:hypothetical protein
MCDYSLEHYHSRPAQEGEEYISNRFPSGSIGFVVPGDQSVAVCMACDMRLKLANIPAGLQSRLGIAETAPAEFARFNSGPYRDGVRFEDGQAVTLQELGTGVRAWVVDALSQRHADYGVQWQRHADLGVERQRHADLGVERQRHADLGEERQRPLVDA